MWWSGLVVIPLACLINWWLSKLDQKALHLTFQNNKDSYEGIKEDSIPADKKEDNIVVDADKQGRNWPFFVLHALVNLF
jgi:hypothetical protein